MHNTNIPVSPTAPAKGKEEAVNTSLHAKPRMAATARIHTHSQPKGLLQRIVAFLQRLFSPVPPLPPVKAHGVAEAVQPSTATLPIAFKGGTAITLATPMGAYAGKPAQQRMRKLAEQQFHHMDVTQVTMN
jgi:hypothetical protein